MALIAWHGLGREWGGCVPSHISREIFGRGGFPKLPHREGRDQGWGKDWKKNKGRAQMPK